jgi:hypothetical protein
MRLDPEVSRLKYESEMKRLIEQRATLEMRGIFVLTSSIHPYVDLLFVPRHRLLLAIPLEFAGQALPSNLPPDSMFRIEIPSISARAFRVRIDLSDYDLRAPSLEFLDAWSGQPLDYATMFRALEFEKQRGSHIVLLPDHPVTHKPFLCVRGVREYHEHPQHSGDDWMLYRDTMSLFSIIMSLWRVALDIVRPQIVVKQTGTQIQWIPEEKL